MRSQFIIKASLFLLVAGGIFLIFGTRELSHDNQVFMGVMSLMQALVLVAPAYFLWTSDAGKQRLITNLQLSLVLAFFLNNIGSFGLYDLYSHNFQYDKIVHFLNSFILLLSITYFVAGWFSLPLGGSMGMALALVLTGGVSWEVIELVFDWIFDTKLLGLGIGGHLKELDTVLDVVFDVAGAGTAVFIVLLRIWNGRRMENKDITFTWR